MDIDGYINSDLVLPDDNNDNVSDEREDAIL